MQTGFVVLLSATLLAPAPSRAADAAGLEAAVARMARIGSAGSPSFSPDGSRLAFVANLSGLPQVWTVAAEGGWPELVTGLEDPVGFVAWSPDGQWLAFTLAPGGGMNQQVYLVRPDGREMKHLTAGGKETNQLIGWSRDGRALLMGSNRRNGTSIDPYIHNVASGESKLVSQAPGINALVDLTNDRRRGLLDRLVSRGDNDLYLLDLASGKETKLTPHEGPGSFDGVFSPDGRRVYLSSNKERDRLAFARIELTPEGAPGPIEVLAARDDAELQGFEIDEQGRTAALLWNVAGRSELMFVDLATGLSTQGPALPSEIAGGLSFSRDGRFLALTLSGAAAPPDIWTLEMSSKRLRQVTRSPHAGVDLASLVRPELLRFEAHDGLALSGWLYKPAGFQPPGPIVLSFHGGPEGQERPSFRSDYQALLASGIAVLAPNVRGSSGFGKRFVNLDNGALRKDGVRDIEACIAAVVRPGIADPRRIGIMGGSYGGYMVMAGMTEFPDAFAAGANLFGVVNFETFFKHTEPWMAAISTVEYGDPKTQAALLRELSPIHRLDRVKAPLLVLHGANDTNVPVVEAEQIVERLKQRGVPVEYILFPDEGHGWRKTANRIRSTVAITRFFVERLKDLKPTDGSRPDPGRRDARDPRRAARPAAAVAGVDRRSDPAPPEVARAPGRDASPSVTHH
jgi:dipeptidyl aminopeptidase/acylaminoacyl peptidase